MIISMSWPVERFFRCFTHLDFCVGFAQWISFLVLAVFAAASILEIVSKKNLELTPARRRERIVKPARAALWLSVAMLLLTLPVIFLSIGTAIESYREGAGSEKILIHFAHDVLLPLRSGLLVLSIGVIQYYMCDFFSVTGKQLKEKNRWREIYACSRKAPGSSSRISS